MSIVAFGIIGKHNEPLYIRIHSLSTDDVNADSESLCLQSIIFTSLDVIEEKRGKKQVPSAIIGDNFLGQLFVIEDYRIYGTISNTLTKLVIVLDASIAVSNEAVREVFAILQRVYVNFVMNPFYEIGASINSKEFDQKINTVIEKFNKRTQNS
jgi:trafficking protein particle complex subunit 2